MQLTPAALGGFETSRKMRTIIFRNVLSCCFKLLGNACFWKAVFIGVITSRWIHSFKSDFTGLFYIWEISTVRHVLARNSRKLHVVTSDVTFFFFLRGFDVPGLIFPDISFFFPWIFQVMTHAKLGISGSSRVRRTHDHRCFQSPSGLTSDGW